MARAMKCDRCGKYFDKNIAFPTNENIINGREPTYLRGVATINSEGSRYKYYDLCDECLKDFMDFIMGPDEEETDD